ncbi:MAG: hypothetical protein QOG78_3621 [Rhodospirillaceae bacterium]|nr:hypothetical protein [Rhodospirillaceae bacterium]
MFTHFDSFSRASIAVRKNSRSPWHPRAQYRVVVLPGDRR